MGAYSQQDNIQVVSSNVHPLDKSVKDFSSVRHGIAKGPTSESPPPSESGPVSRLDPSQSTSNHIVPWTIVNRYYTADVHFETRTFEEFVSHHASGVPAVIYAWSREETYKDHLPLLEAKLGDHDPEVSLAVRFGGGAATQSVPDIEDGLDEFVSSHGFEFIDGDRDSGDASRDGERFSTEGDSGIPGLPRVIDALSTIMWPSLVQSEGNRNRRSRARDLLDWAREEEEDDGLRALVSQGDGERELEDQLFDEAHSTKKSRMQREMEELEKWLEEDDHNSSAHHLRDHQAWIHPDIEGIPDSWAGVPTPTLRTPGNGDPEVGFEDDFTEFVGAPVDVVYPHQERLRPHHTGTSYQSLTSMEGLGTGGDDCDNDPDLPSQAEIEETSRKIFGNSVLDPPNPSHHLHPSGSSATQSHVSSSSSHLSVPGPSPALLMTPDSPFSSFGHDNEDVDDGFELGAFDLSRVLSALQGMKEEIAGMSDEGARRKAAARVALGLVYGLQKEDERDGLRTESSS